MDISDAAKRQFSLGLAALDARDFGKAAQLFENTLEFLPNSIPALNNLIFCEFQQKKFPQAIKHANRVLEIDRSNIDAHQALMLCHRELAQYELALAACDNLLRGDPTNSEAHSNKAAILNKLQRYEAAVSSSNEAIKIAPRSANAFLNRGNAWRSLKNVDAAIADYEEAISMNPKLAEAFHGQGSILIDLKRFDEAIVLFRKAVAFKPDLENAWVGLGTALAKLKQYDEAFAACDRALAIKPDLAEGWLCRGDMFYDLKRCHEAGAAYDKALTAKPDLAEGWLRRGVVFDDLKQYDKAFAAYDKALSVQPGSGAAEGARLFSKTSICNWPQLDQDIASLVHVIRTGQTGPHPFSVLSLIDAPEDHYRCAAKWVSERHTSSAAPLWQKAAHAHDRIRIGYVSSDFRRHAVAHLIAEVFELHDRAKFEITAVSLGPDDKSDIRRRLMKSFDRFLDGQNLSDAQIAKEIAGHGIDILIDLNGLTQDARTDIFAYRPAPIQVNYLGYPGTMGAPYIDYIVGDGTLFAMSDEKHYSEKLIRLPYSYQPNDRMREISAATMSREVCGLPDEGVVFCCFNNSYKILPDTFDSWMRILNRLDGSVLWLLQDSPAASDNLKREAVARGVDPARLVFATRVDLPNHLARHRLADLFLDTLPYNAHTTASDALWAGLPVLTQKGQAFAGRVGASLLKAVGLPELITGSREEYEARAIELALDRDKLQGIKERLGKNRATAPLFDTPLYTRSLEAALEAIYRRHQSGLPPDHIEIGPVSMY